MIYSKSYPWPKDNWQLLLIHSFLSRKCLDSRYVIDCLKDGHAFLNGAYYMINFIYHVMFISKGKLNQRVLLNTKSMIEWFWDFYSVYVFYHSPSKKDWDTRLGETFPPFRSVSEVNVKIQTAWRFDQYWTR